LFSTSAFSAANKKIRIKKATVLPQWLGARIILASGSVTYQKESCSNTATQIKQLIQAL
tara:strand:- start:1483 stop:1659 length:177 start_codon:yes stop_codon:yes gene_type:complete